MSNRHIAAVLYALCACGRLDFDPFGAAGDAASDALPTSGPWAQVYAGEQNVCARKTTGEAWCWGGNVFRATTANPASLWSLPVKLPGQWLELAVTIDHGCGIQVDRTLWCWGDNSQGQLADGTTTSRATPMQVGTGTWLNVKVAPIESCALDTGNVMWCWGNNSGHQFSALSQPAFTSPTMIDTTVNDFMITSSRTCATRMDGTMYCIGANNNGELGNGTPGTDFLAWTQVGTDSDWNRISGAQNHTCGIKTNGTLWCWGYGGDGRTGIGDNMEHDLPTQVGTSASWTSVLAATSHTCAHGTDNTLYCFGTGGHGELGAEVARVSSPMMIAADVNHYGLGLELTCYIDSLGLLRCGGGASNGQLAIAGSPSHPVQADARTDWQALAMYLDTTCAIDMAGNGWCWGKGTEGQIGDGATTDRQLPTMLAGTGWTAVAPAQYFTTGVRGGTLYEWGQNFATKVVHMAPTVLSASVGWSLTSGGGNHACATEANVAYCWGEAPDVGYTTASDVAAPTTALSGSWSALGAGTGHTCGYQSGQIACWGTNMYGQLANGTLNPSVTPAGAMCAGSACLGTPSKIVGGDRFACALFTDQHLACWGDATYGELGNGDLLSKTAVTVATPYTDWIDIAAGDLHACGIRANGTMWCWGHGDGGQLGNDLVPNKSLTPTQAGTDTDWASVAAGDHDVCALKTDHTRWCWGNNEHGSLGDGKAWVPGFVIVANSL